LSVGFNSSVNSAIVDSYGKIVAGGGFITFNSQSFNRLIRLYPCQT
jgi:hypothetical protein